MKEKIYKISPHDGSEPYYMIAKKEHWWQPYVPIPFHNKPVSITDRPVPEMVVLPAEAAAIQSSLSDVMAQSNKIPTPASILLQPDDLARLVPQKEPKVMFAGALDPDTLAHSRYTIHHK